ncbi:MAG TPA: translation initiation factor IF-2 [Paludibaculum sp.]|jgi:translation initiation factor IF-2
MKKIRINELARELEVKPGSIIDLLAEYGVSEKKTHSSSIDEDVALKVRDRLVGATPRPRRDDVESVFSPEHAPPRMSDIASTPAQSTLFEPAPPVPPPSSSASAHLPVKEITHEAAAPAAIAAPAAHPAPPVTPRAPIRPPLAMGGIGRGPGALHAPSIPIPTRTIVAHPIVTEHAAPPPTPPVAHVAPPAHSAPAQPVEPAKVVAPALPKVAVPGAPVETVTAAAAPAIPAPPAVAHKVAAKPAVPARPPVVTAPAAPASPAMPGAPLAPAAPAMPAAPRAAAPAQPDAPKPAAPRPGPSAPLQRNAPISQRAGAPATPRPGQIISGPRTPLPGGEAPKAAAVAPGVPRTPAAPAMPRPQNVVAPAAPRPPQAPHQAGQPTRPPLVGQPSARPVVPPRADILARLQQQTPARVMPGQPTAPRPGMPTPGQPIYPGARRGPTGPGGGPVGSGGGHVMGRPVIGGALTSRPMRGRGPHPTSPVLEPPPPTSDPSRRNDGKKRGPQRDHRERDTEGKLKPMFRKSEIAPPPPIDREITISEGVTVKELSEKLGVKVGLVIKQLVDRKIFATINQTLDTKLAEEISRAFGAATSKMSYEQEAVQDVDSTEVEGDLTVRPPIVTIMGHVDHGKTSLLDAIRTTNVAGREAGGITQHIGAYHVEIGGRKIVFIDTPGHEAFTRMRARGSKVTDIVVLVVAADDGVMPQTREAIDHARAAKVPIVVAVNKIDKPGATPERVKQQLTELGLQPEDWGGDTPFVMVSAKEKQNLDLLLEVILLVADVTDIKGNPARPGLATVLEAKLDKGRGPVATLLVRNGTLHVGDHYLCGTVFGKIRALFDDRGNPVKEVGPSMPVELLGLESMPDVGDTLQIVTDLGKARQIAEFREIRAREVAMAKTRITLDQFHAQLREGETKELNIIIKADVGGTSEVLSDTLQKLSTDKVNIRVIMAGVGAITESDVDLASASNAIIIGFNVRPERKASDAAQLEKVDIRLHTIIYELTDEIKKAMTGMLDPVFKEVYKGRADVRTTFRITKVGTVAGCQVTDGVIPRDAQVRLLRDNIVVHTGRLDSLKRFKNDASEVKAGFECGIALVGYNDLKPGDIIEAFIKEKVAPDLSA